ncbi:N-terminal kinase-like protein [Planococcus citri]|uniref:N-terminal kinase-like protein n=1 Tax=Planococcus citri TaxID=170843 RepID=UPI0031F8EB4A
MWSFFSRDASKDFAYEIGESLFSNSEDSVWNLHKGKKKNGGDDVSIFLFNCHGSTENQLSMAKNSVKRLKTLRHPSILQYIDSHETDKALLLVTEFVEPLNAYLTNSWRSIQEKDMYLSWGIFQITRALSFLNNDGNLKHNNVCMASIFVNLAGEWKLGCVEHMTGASDGDGVPIKILPSLEKYSPPEKTDSFNQRHSTKCSTDMWGLGCLIWEVYNGCLPHQSALRSSQKIPKSFIAVYNELITAKAASRPNPADVITRCRKNDGFFKNELIDTLLFLEEIHIKDKNEKGKFFASLTSLLDHFPDRVCRFKILPHLINAFEYGEAGAAVLTPLLKLGNLLEDIEYQKKIVPCVVKLFNCNDRATRSKLLQQMESYIGHLQASTINDQIFPQIVNGFLDTNPMIREQTIKCMIHLSPKLNYNNLNVEILRHFARLQSKDDQGGIRTNTTVCLGKISVHLHPQIRQKVLISAFIRAMRDPFPPARTAGVLALAATQQYFLISEISSRILPALCQLTIDPDKSVRDHVFRTVKGFLGKLEKLSEDPTLRESMEADVHASTPSLSNAAATWAGWAVTAVTAKFYRSQSESARPSTPRISRSIRKPCSLEQPPSSSSISTTTTSSEVTSLGSFEQEDRALDSVSDYEENWECENWGEIQMSDDNSRISSTILDAEYNDDSSQKTTETNTQADGWDDGGDWDSIQDMTQKLQVRDQREICSDADELTDWSNEIECVAESRRVNVNPSTTRDERRIRNRTKDTPISDSLKKPKRGGITKLGAKKL